MSAGVSNKLEGFAVERRQFATPGLWGSAGKGREHLLIAFRSGEAGNARGETLTGSEIAGRLL
jgi:hypothetical protein